MSLNRLNIRLRETAGEFLYKIIDNIRHNGGHTISRSPGSYGLSLRSLSTSKLDVASIGREDKGLPVHTTGYPGLVPGIRGRCERGRGESSSSPRKLHLERPRIWHTISLGSQDIYAFEQVTRMHIFAVIMFGFLTCFETSWPGGWA